MASTPHAPMPQAAQVMYDSIMNQLAHVDTCRNAAIRHSQQVITTFERRYRMTSADMVSRLYAGQIAETDDICQWMFELDVLRDTLADQP